MLRSQNKAQEKITFIKEILLSTSTGKALKSDFYVQTAERNMNMYLYYRENEQW